MQRLTVWRWWPVLLVLALAGCEQGEAPATEDSAQSSAKTPVEQSDSPSAAALDSRWLTHLQALPSGAVSARAPWVIRFNHPVVAQTQLNTPLSGVAKLSPEHPVDAVFTARDRLEIRHRQPLPAGEAVTLLLYPTALEGVDDNLPVAELALQVLRQQFSVTVLSLEPDPEDGALMRLSGRLSTRDLATPEQVQAVVSADLDGQSLPLDWQHQSGGLDHTFTVKGIRRGDRSGQLLLRWQGQSLGLPQQDERPFSVPALARFAVTTVRTVSYPQPHLQVDFSEALRGGQNLTGLVTLNGAQPRLEVDGSLLRVYPAADTDDEVTLRLEAELGSARHGRLGQPWEQTFTLAVDKPGVRFVGKGSILPKAEQLTVPFEAMGVHSVKVQAFQVYGDNIGRYLQNYQLDQAVMDNRSGRYLWQKTLPLASNGSGWQRYQLDLSELMAAYPQGLLHLRLVIDGETINYQCPSASLTRSAELPDDYEGPGQSSERGDIYSRYYAGAGYLRWSEQDNPCSDSYYAYNDLASSSRAFLASNLGLIAKQGQNNQLLVTATTLDDNQPAARVALTAYNYQQQPIGRAQTDSEGMARLSLDGTPFYLQAEQGEQRGYLKLARNQALPTNQFNTGGQTVAEGLKGFFYGERDVWRPGDDIHLTFILEDQQDLIPDDHPLLLDWFDPRGNKVSSYRVEQPVGDFYRVTLSTAEDAPTGRWRVVARLGERYFDSPLRIETVTPNRLKIELTAAERLHANEAAPLGLFSQWLNGASAAGLKVDVSVRVNGRSSEFEGYQGYQFDDPTRELKSEPFSAFEGVLDAKGRVEFPLTVPLNQPPGMVNAVLTSRVFERSGDYSTQVRALPVYPYGHWVGMQVPQGSGWGNALSRDDDHLIDLLTLASDGKPAAGRQLELTVYRIDWRWWWDRTDDKLTNFISNPNTRELSRQTLQSDQQGRVQWTLRGEDYEWGRHLIRVCDRDSQHCSAETVYLGWSWSQAAASQDAATRLSLSADREQYQVGQTAMVQLPAVASGRLLVSLETGSQVLEQYWLPASGGNQVIKVPITAAMAPNVYLHVALLQPHSGRNNDRPIRMYGLLPLLVEDPQSRLQPQLVAPAKVAPEQAFTLQVSEQQGRAMTYTLAVVDEGLLGLTNFRTPDPHAAFYRREALGVLTWDLFDMVVGAYAAELDQILALGGSDGLDDGRETQRRRFPPVVEYLGPFQLAANETASHTLTLPPYMGEVRAMLVAGQEGAYGNAEQAITVSQPLTLLSSLPRVLGPGEALSLPVTVFVAEPGITEVAITVEADESFFTLDSSTATANFSGTGEQLVLLDMQVREQVGTGTVTITARAGDHETRETVHIPIRAANPATTRDQQKPLQPGESWSLQGVPHGLPGTNSATLTVSALPAMGLERRLDYLLRYPHGCVEQVTSAVLPQLYLPQLLSLSAEQQQSLQENVAAAVQRLGRYQQGDGGFSYWPGQGGANDWGSSYAGHFLLEARRLGHAVPASLLDNWQRYQIRQSQNLGMRPWNWSTEAYRQYTLALAGEPQVGAMNRLRERLQAAADQYAANADYQNSRWLLAAAYLQMGLNDVAAELLAGSGAVPDYPHAGPTYGSPLRDQAVRLLVADAIGDQALAWEQAGIVAEQLASERWYSTQTTAWALMAMARYAGGSEQAEAGYDVAIRSGEQPWAPVHFSSASYQQTLSDADQVQALSLRNDSERRLFATLSYSGVPAPGGEQAVSNGLQLRSQFRSLDGAPLSVQRLPQGTDFQAIVTLTNTGNQTLENIALSQVLPSGWQISSSRLSGYQTPEGVDYQDIRDDRLLSYFDLKPGAKEALTLTLDLHASFAGRFYLPSWQAEAMYDGSKQARSRGQWVEVFRPAP